MQAQETISTAERLNATCGCVTLDSQKLLAELKRAAPVHPAFDRMPVTHPHLFASVPSFVSADDLAAMGQVVKAVERIAALPAYRAHVLGQAPSVAHIDHGQRGAMMGYDFHITRDGPRLIEINTNAGGGFLNAVLRDAQQACCEDIGPWPTASAAAAFAPRVAEMFRTEWAAQFPSRPLRTVAIVDDTPAEQYLYPEFLLAQAMLEQTGLTALICDPADLLFDGTVLSAHGAFIDLVYNRHVDFMLEAASVAVLRDAYVAGAIALTPNPHHHAVLANKANLAVLSDAERLRAFGATPSDIALLRAVPRTQIVDAANAAELWDGRKHTFFKPSSGHGGKAVYRGDKLTMATWQRIRNERYVAQELVRPGRRRVGPADSSTQQKLDVRLYSYGGETLMAAARIYQGQTTNFRTPGGGFSPLFVV